ncbi:histidinol-phosphate transaminase [Dermabacteraceae bacterium TAE3-ERU27]|nr:histidinol-phosphate transaminase [Dermabacteraceae bacterium TAE3-ERU27]
MTTPEEQVRFRPCLSKLPVYAAGKPAPDGFKVSSNESPFTPPAKVREAIIAHIDGLNRYPSPAVEPLRSALAARHGVEPHQIVVSTGSVAVLGDVVRALVDEGDEVVYAWRSFEAYPILVGCHGGESVQVPLTAGLGHDLDAMAAAVTDRTRAVIVCNPNNPTGTVIGQAELEEFVAKIPAHVAVVIDEAYLEFIDAEAQIDAEAIFRRHANVLILRTFSKVHGIAGLRIGYAIAHPKMAAALRAVSVPFSANSLAQAGALACLDDEVHAELMKRAAHIRTERARVYAALEEQGWHLPPHSEGNFVYLPLAERTQEFAAFAAERGLITRAYASDGVRVTIGEDEANSRFIEIAREWHNA